ncbi:MAG: VWA domain-containing protein [Acidobacteriota bacterium]
MSARAAFSVFVGLSTAILSAEDVSKSFQETAEVTLVTVPVTVLGRDGKPIGGLGPADFELRDDGVRQTILSVDVVDLGRRAGSGSAAELPSPSARRHFLLLFDMSFSKPAQIVRAREAAAKFVDGGMAQDDLAAVATTSIDRGARLVETFTTDRKQLAAAIRSVGLMPSEDSPLDPLQFAFVMPGDPNTNKLGSGESHNRAGRSLVDPSTARVYTVMAQKGEDRFATTGIERQLSSIDALSRALNTVEGRKTIVYFSEGFEGRLLFGSLARQRSAQDAQADNDAMLNSHFQEVDSERRVGNASLQRHLDGTLDLLRRSDCTVYAIDLSGVKVDGDPSFGQEVHGGDSLYAFANGTGGEVLKNSNDFDSQMQRIVEKTSLTYVLAYRPTRKSGPGVFHHLKVSTGLKGARVSARAGYYENRLFRSLSPLERSLSAADVIAHEKSAGDLPMNVMALPLEAQPLARIPVVLEIPGPALLKGAPQGPLHLDLYVYAFNAAGEVADFFARSVTMEISQREALRGGAFRYCGSIRVLAGRYRLRAYARENERGRHAFQVVWIDVPEGLKASLHALPPLFVSAETATGVSVSEPAGKESAAVSEVFQIGGDGFIPELSPQLESGKPARLCVMVYSHGRTADEAFQLEATVLGAGGRRFPPARFVVLGRSLPDTTGLQKLLVEFTPTSLPAGEYSLSLTLRDKGQSSGTRAETPFRILHQAAEK